MDIVVRSPNWIGDCIMCLPALRFLADRWPEANVYLASKKSLCPIYENIPHIAGIIPLPDNFDFKSMFTTAHRLGSYGFYYGILFTNSFQSALLFKLAGIKKLTGCGKDLRGWMLSEKVKFHRDNNHQIFFYLDIIAHFLKFVAKTAGGESRQQNFDLSIANCLSSIANESLDSKPLSIEDSEGSFLEARPTDGPYRHPSVFGGKKPMKDFLPLGERFLNGFLEARPPDGSYCHPSVFRGKKLMSNFFPLEQGFPGSFLEGMELVISPAERECVSTVLSGLGIDGILPRIGISPFAAFGSAKEWPPERFSELIRRLRENPPLTGAEILLFGSPREKEKLSLIMKSVNTGGIHNLAGKLTLRQSLVALSSCCLFIGNDSGLMHAASALKVPLVALFGPTPLRKSKPLQENARTLHHPVKCAPCRQRVCPLDQDNHACMKAISVDEVMESAVALLRQYPPSSPSLPIPSTPNPAPAS